MDDALWQWQRNVVDEFKSLSNEEIIKVVDERSHNFAVMMTQIAGDFNFSSLVRSANFLGAKEIFYYGKKKWDRRGSTGSYLYKKITYLKEFDELASLKEKYNFIALENNIDRKCEDLRNFKWPTNKPNLIIIGEESCGLQDKFLDLCDYFVYISGRGSIRSLNAAVAGSIAMQDLVSKNFTK